VMYNVDALPLIVLNLQLEPAKKVILSRAVIETMCKLYLIFFRDV